MSAMTCEQCSAPLPLGEPGTIITCPYCGTQTRVEPPASSASSPETEARRAALLGAMNAMAAGRTQQALAMRAEAQAMRETERRGRRVAAVVVLVIAAVAIAVGAAATVHQRAIRGTSAGQAPSATAMSQSQLASFAEQRWTSLDPAGMPGAFAAFDAVAAYPWALSLARRWSPDARLESLWVRDARPDGGLDLGGGRASVGHASVGHASVEYRFDSPARREAAARMRQVSQQPLVAMLRLRLREAAVEVMASPSAGLEERLQGSPGCSLAAVLQTMREHGLAQRPTYDLRLTYQQGHDWIWHASGARSDLRGVSAQTCAAVR